MLISFGVFSAAGAGAGAAAGAYELISTAYGTGSSGTITFSSIPSTYKHLQLRHVARSTAAASDLQVQLRFNSDTGTNYTLHRLFGNGSTVTSQGYTTQSGAYVGLAAGSNAPANAHGVSVLDILDYASSSKNTTTRTFSGRQGEADRSILLSSVWLNTTAVTSIVLYDGGGGNFTSTSRFSLYGIKG